ncbi:MAG: outer membrane protein transport protein [Rhodocyclales bacterium]|nr:outer membrane protein transport protein [Rhodocyclales bacterium]
MNKGLTMRLIPALIMAGFAGAASAAGFQLLEQNASGIGNAYAGSAAVADNASTIFYNPAGMTQLQEREFSVGVSAVKPSFNFTDKGSSVGNLAGSGDGGDAGGWGFIPNAYLSWALTKDLYVGLGISGPFGLKTEYDDRWLGAAQGVKFDIKTLNINPSVAYRLNDKVSLGAGLNWQRIDAEYVRMAATTTVGTSHVVSTMKLDDDAWGWNVGALFTLSPSTKVGLSYRSEVKYHTTGDVKLADDGTGLGTATAAGLIAAGRQSDLKAKITLPDTFIASVSQQLSDKWEMLGDISWTGWSSIPKVDIMRTSGALNGLNAQTLDTDFRDTWRVALGANYKYNDAWKLKFGVAYDETPVKRAATRLASMPDNNRLWFSTGAQWMPTKTSKLDLGLAYLYVKDSKINNNQTASGRGTLTGEYEASVWILGAQYSMAF